MPNQLTPQYAYLAKEGGPKMLAEMLAHLGLAEIPGKASDSTIMAWAKEVGASSYYPNDDVPWCGLAMAHCAKVAGKLLPPDPLAAKNWAKFGIKSPKPSLGDIVVFPHHVAIYVGETATTYSLLGGNQGDKIGIANFLKSAAIAVRRPIYNVQPSNVRPILLNAAGPVGGKIV